jgi:hypothetical protein
VRVSCCASLATAPVVGTAAGAGQPGFPDPQVRR